MINRKRAFAAAYAAVVLSLGWQCLRPVTRDELRMRARCARNILAGRPVTYRVTVNYSGPGPAFYVDSKNAIVTGCTVFAQPGRGSW